MKNIITEKKDNVSSRQFERNQQIFSNFHNGNPGHILERPVHNTNLDNKEHDSNLSRFAIPQKASLGYDPIISSINPTERSSNQITHNMEEQFGTIGDNTLPSNIYHNFSLSTRTTEKKVNYDINNRNTDIFQRSSDNYNIR